MGAETRGAGEADAQQAERPSSEGDRHTSWVAVGERSVRRSSLPTSTLDTRDRGAQPVRGLGEAGPQRNTASRRSPRGHGGPGPRRAGPVRQGPSTPGGPRAGVLCRQLPEQ